MTLSTGWGHPSPLELYYHQNNIEYPFQMLSTANYRGHVATWHVANTKLYLASVRTDSTELPPSQFNIFSNTTVDQDSIEVFADWFSGIIESYRYDTIRIGDQVFIDRTQLLETYFFHVRNGHIISIENYESDLVPSSSKLGKMNKNYITYYFRLRPDDIVVDGKSGLLSVGEHKLSPIIKYYGEDHLDWPFNWENLSKSGAPHATWSIDDNKLFLNKLERYYGLLFDNINKEELDLTQEFSSNKHVFAEWVTGVYLVFFGKNVKKPYEHFKIKNYQILNFKNGMLTHSYVLDGDFDFKNPPSDTSPELIELIDQL